VAVPVVALVAVPVVALAAVPAVAAMVPAARVAVPVDLVVPTAVPAVRVVREHPVRPALQVDRAPQRNFNQTQLKLGESDIGDNTYITVVLSPLVFKLCKDVSRLFKR
jgi:hypothetical protein